MLLFNKTYCLTVSIGKNIKCTPSKVGGDRFIPIRNGQQLDVASFLLTKENEPLDPNNPALVMRCNQQELVSSPFSIGIIAEIC
jgi:hypothetical protein